MAMKRRNRDRSVDLEMQAAFMAAEASISMADVDIPGLRQRQQQTSCLRFSIRNFGYLLAIGSMLLSVSAIAVEQALIVYVAMGIAILLSPVVIVQRRTLLREDGFREIHNELRLVVNELSAHNAELECQNDTLQEQVQRLKRAEDGLDNLVGKQGGQVDAFVDLVKENGRIQKEVMKLLMEEAVASIIEVVLQSDQDGDFHIDPEEIDLLILRLKHSRGIEELDEDGFRKMLSTEGKSLETVLEIAKNLLGGGDEEKKVVKVSSRGLHL